jgi:hypothetical protein
MIPMKVGIVACEVFEKEIDLLTEGDHDIVYKEYVEFGEHVFPEKMKETLIKKVNALEGKVDSVFLGYGVCQSLKGVTNSLRVPTIMLEADDCIGTFLTQAGYEAERKKCTGTWFAIPFFSDMAIEKLTKEMHLDKIKNPKYDAMWFIRKFFEGYSRALYVDTGIGERESYESKSMDFAQLLNLRHESMDGTLALLKEGIEKAKTLAQAQPQSE